MGKECILDNVFDRDRAGCDLQCIVGYDCNYYQEKAKQHCKCDACKNGIIHASDCAVHNKPEKKNKRCNCK